MKRSALFKALRIAIVPLTLAGFFLYLFFVEGRGMIGKVFSSLMWRWLVAAVAVWAAGALFYDISLASIRRHYQKRFPFWYVPLNTRKAAFYEMLTPGTFAFGPAAQVNSMSKQGVPVSRGVTIILVQQACSVASYMIYSIVFTLWNFRFFSSNMSPFMWLVYAAALAMSAVIMMIYLLVPRNDRPILAAARALTGVLAKIRVIRAEKKERLDGKIETNVRKLKENMRSLDLSAFEWGRSVFLLILEKIAIGCVQFFIAKALAVDVSGSLLLLVAAQSMVTIISNQIAIPGGFGVQELSYYVFMLPIIGSQTALNFMLLLNRIVTYYFPLLIGGLALFIKNPGKGPKVQSLEDCGDSESQACGIESGIGIES